MSHVEGHISIAELLGNQQASKVSFGEQGEIKAIESKPLAPPQPKVQQPLKPTKVPTLSESRGQVQSGIGSIGDFLGSPRGTQVLATVGRELSKTTDSQGRTTSIGLGGQLANIAESNLESQQFANLTRKLEAGEEITATDLVGLDRESQQAAAGIISAKSAASRDQERIDLTAKAVQSATELRQAQVGQIKAAPDVATEAAQRKVDADITALDKRLASGTLNNRDTNATRLQIAQLQLDKAEATSRSSTVKLTPTDINTLSKSLLPLETFKIIQDKSGFGAGDLLGLQAGGDEQETLAKLGNEGFSEAQFKTLTGNEPTIEQKAELDVINRFKRQMDIFKEQSEFSLGAGVEGGVPAPVSESKDAQVATLKTMSPQELSAIVASIPVAQRLLIEKAAKNKGFQGVLPDVALAEAFIRSF